MAKISNTTVYPTVTPADNDLLILTDATDSNKTKTVLMSGVKSYLNVDTFNATRDGYFYANIKLFRDTCRSYSGCCGKTYCPAISIGAVKYALCPTPPLTRTANEALSYFWVRRHQLVRMEYRITKCVL